ncbi:hypothetical protein Val02_90940 [Virgisporangium aliadipatigenens]|uniref:non-specific serine/threonine protein kinase n=1 Tax=Virgisporangium aliadipatigenens TaxID=741659 RepID=A0A8J3YZ22_9ACTN|nr:serine/threonine-protein kinase [Virgisporangium aliadipatigenens]GIJ52208.1 hypothetical protein Val02_90940 [Virgisporangium aliadipatigenens]
MLPQARLDDRYLLARAPFAHDGMGEVWPARDTRLDRNVVVKTLTSTSNVDLVRRFKREARLTARLEHPGVPAVYDFGVHEGHPYLVLQKITGVTLTDLTAEQGQLPIAWVAAIGAQISSVLIAAQEIGLVHRDLKPSNVMLEPSGAVKVLDFGLAALRDDERYSRITRTGEAPGTVGYMAPEQILAEPTDHRSDLYGLGGVLYHLLTAEHPVEDGSAMTTAARQLDRTPPRPSRRRPDTPPALDDLVHALLARHPDERPATARHVYDTLAPLAGNPPPMPGVINDGADPVRHYCAVVGQNPASPPVAPRPRAKALDRDDDAEQLFTAGRYRDAARRWRQLADRVEEQHGPGHPQVFDWRLRAARAHIPLNEHSRALRQMEILLAQRIRLDGADHPAVLDLQKEIAAVRAASPAVG